MTCPRRCRGPDLARPLVRTMLPERWSNGLDGQATMVDRRTRRKTKVGAQVERSSLVGVYRSTTRANPLVYIRLSPVGSHRVSRSTEYSTHTSAPCPAQCRRNHTRVNGMQVDEVKACTCSNRIGAPIDNRYHTRQVVTRTVGNRAVLYGRPMIERWRP